MYHWQYLLTTEQTFTLVSILLTFLNVAITYLNLKHNRKKEFQDKLYNLKLEAYTELNNAYVSLLHKLDVNESPFTEIRDYKDEKTWRAYCKIHMKPLMDEAVELHQLVFKYSVIIPNEIIGKHSDFATSCGLFVTGANHFDKNLIIHNQDKLQDLYVNMSNEFRKDLGIAVTDYDLKRRINS